MTSHFVPGAARVIVVFVLLAFWGDPAAAASRVALVVGVGSYEHGSDLQNTRSDAQIIARAFRLRGFKVDLVLDPTRREMLEALANLRLSASDADLVAIYFSGHGAQINGQPVVFLRNSRFSAEGQGEVPLSLQTMVRAVSDKPRQKLFLIDACRSVDVWSGGQSFAAQGLASAGLHIEFASQYGAPAFDGAAGMGPFAAAWAAALIDTESRLDVLSRMARLSVIRSTGGLQIPWSQSSLLRPIDLGPPDLPTE